MRFVQKMLGHKFLRIWIFFLALSSLSSTAASILSGYEAATPSTGGPHTRLSFSALCATNPFAWSIHEDSIFYVNGSEEKHLDVQILDSRRIQVDTKNGLVLIIRSGMIVYPEGLSSVLSNHRMASRADTVPILQETLSRLNYESSWVGNSSEGHLFASVSRLLREAESLEEYLEDTLLDTAESLLVPSNMEVTVVDIEEGDLIIATLPFDLGESLDHIKLFEYMNDWNNHSLFREAFKHVPALATLVEAHSSI